MSITSRVIFQLTPFLFFHVLHNMNNFSAIAKSNPFLLGMNAVQVEWAIPRDLAQSFFSRNTSLESDNESESNLSPKIEKKQSLLKILARYKNDHSKFLIKDYINKSCVGDDSTSFASPLSKAKTGVQPIQPSEFESLLPFNTDRIQPKTNGNYLNYLDKTNGRWPNEAAALLPANHFNPPDISTSGVYGENENFITEFQNSDYRYRDMHLKTWLQSLSYSDQFAYCAASPSLTSHSTGSSTNSSCKWDESCSQFSVGSGMSGGYDVKDLQLKGITKKCTQLAIY